MQKYTNPANPDTNSFALMPLSVWDVRVEVKCQPSIDFSGTEREWEKEKKKKDMVKP